MTDKPVTKKLPALLIALAAAAAPLAATAASHDRDIFIKEQDLNGDGKVSKEEFALGRDREYARVDADKSGGVSKDEYLADFRSRLDALLARQPAERRQEERVRELRQADVRFGVLDSDKSGSISPAEFAYSGWRMFTRHETNGDGFVSAADPKAADPD